MSKMIALVKGDWMLRKHITCLIILAGCTLLSQTAIAQGPSFNCAKAGISVEKTICSDGELSELDDRLFTLYLDLKQKLGSSQVDGFVATQKKWLRNRNVCGSDVKCLINAYQTRRDQLQLQGSNIPNKGHKYTEFEFDPFFSGPRYIGGTDPKESLSQHAKEWLKTQIGDMNPDDFYILGLVGFLRVEGQGDFVRMGLTAKDKILDRLNHERKKLMKPRVEAVSGNVNLVNMKVFGIFMGGKEILKLERKELPIEHELGTSRYLTDTPVLRLHPFGMGATGVCLIERNLFVADLNLDGYSELFSFEGWDTGFAPRTEGEISYVSLHVNDGRSGKEIFSEVLKAVDDFSDDNYITYKADIAKPYFNLTKLYFVDIDENDLLDILVWKRTYHPKSKKEDDTYDSASWHFTNELFIRFEESPEGFKEVSVTTEQAKKMLNERGLTWRKGFPNQSACKDEKTEPFTFFADSVLHE